MRTRWTISKKNFEIGIMSVIVFHICFLNISYVHIPKYDLIKTYLIILMIPYLLINIRKFLVRKYIKINFVLLLFCVAAFISSYFGKNYVSHSYLLTFKYVMIIVISILYFECINFYGINMWKIVIKIFLCLSLLYLTMNDLLMFFQPSIFRASDELGVGDKFNCFLLGNKFNVVYLHLFFWAFFLLYQQLYKKKNKICTTFIALLVFVISIFVKCSTGVLAIVVFCILSFDKIGKHFIKPVTTFISIGIFDSILFLNSAFLSTPFMKFIIENILGKEIGLTGRLDIYARVGQLLSKSILFGYGYDNNTYVSTQNVLAANVQNGVLDNVISFGLIGTVLLAILIWYCLNFANKMGTMNAFSYLMYTYIVISSVEIAFRTTFITIISLIAFCTINCDHRINETSYNKPDTPI